LRRKHLCASTLIDAEVGKKLQGFFENLHEFYKTVQKLHFQNKKSRSVLDRPKEGGSTELGEPAFYGSRLASPTGVRQQVSLALISIIIDTRGPEKVSGIL
jgi:hypothetical protein